MKFFLLAYLIVQGQEPMTMKAEAPDLKTCFANAYEIQTNPNAEIKKMLENGGVLQTSCAVVYPAGNPA